MDIKVQHNGVVFINLEFHLSLFGTKKIIKHTLSTTTHFVKVHEINRISTPEVCRNVFQFSNALRFII